MSNYSELIMGNEEFSFWILCENNNDVKPKMKEILDKFLKILYNADDTKNRCKFIDKVRDICNILNEALDYGINGYESAMDKKMSELISKFKNNKFFVSELDTNYAFRGVAYLEELKEKWYEERYTELKNGELTFFRAVISKNQPDIKRMLNCPYSEIKNAAAGRFSRKGSSCMYLGTSSYVCAKELEYDEKKDDNLYVSSIKFNSNGRKIKVMNLAISNQLNIYDPTLDKEKIYRKKLWLYNIMFYPIIIATSFRVKNHIDGEEKYEYLLSQSLMRVIKENGIDGIAYATKKESFNSNPFPFGINLAILVDNVSAKNEYGDLKDNIEITDPEKLSEKKIDGSLVKKSFCNEKFSTGYYSKINYQHKYVPYSELIYGRFDNYLVNQKFYQEIDL